MKSELLLVYLRQGHLSGTHSHTYAHTHTRTHTHTHTHRGWSMNVKLTLSVCWKMPPEIVCLSSVCCLHYICVCMCVTMYICNMYVNKVQHSPWTHTLIAKTSASVWCPRGFDVKEGDVCVCVWLYLLPCPFPSSSSSSSYFSFSSSFYFCCFSIFPLLPLFRSSYTNLSAPIFCLYSLFFFWSTFIVFVIPASSSLIFLTFSPPLPLPTLNHIPPCSALVLNHL